MTMRQETEVRHRRQKGDQKVDFKISKMPLSMSTRLEHLLSSISGILYLWDLFNRRKIIQNTSTLPIAIH